MFITKWINPIIRNAGSFILSRKRYSVFGIQDLIYQEKPDQFAISAVTSVEHERAVELIKKHYFAEHVLVKDRKMNLADDRSIDEYLVSLLRQGNSIFARTQDDRVAGICVGYASSQVDPRILRNYAFHRQDPNTKDLLNFIAKLQETPNLWDMFKEPKIYEIKMLTVTPEYRRQGLAALLAEKSIAQAFDQGYKVIRMDCINQYDFKVAERCMLYCLTRFPLHKIRGPNTSYVKQSSENNRYIRVYVEVRVQGDEPDKICFKQRHDYQNLIE